MPLQSKNLEMGVFTKEDEKKMWNTFRQVWKNEPSVDVTITELTDMPITDGSLHYRMASNAGGHVDFGIQDGEMCAHTWKCPHEGRFFLQELEKYARVHNLKLTIPTVLNPRLAKLLEEAGYTMAQVPYHGDMLELWSKKERVRI